MSAEKIILYRQIHELNKVLSDIKRGGKGLKFGYRIHNSFLPILCVDKGDSCATDLTTELIDMIRARLNKEISILECRLRELLKDES